MPDNLQDLQDALMVANQPKGQSKKTFSLDLGIQSKPEKPSFYSFSNDTIDMKYDTLSTGEKVARYESYLPGADNNERLAQNQSTGEKWANGVTKALAKTGSAVVGGTVGIVNGVGAALSDGNFSSLYDNNFSNWLADLDTKLSYQLPNYYTKQEQDKGLFGQMGTANFWADKFLGGLSFTGGAIISEAIWAYATGGASLATTGARLGARAGRALRWSSEALGSEAAVLKGIKTFKDLYKPIAGAAYKTGAQATRAAIIGGKTGELVNLGRFALTSAGYESSVEALQYKREAEENFYNNFESLNGRAPNSEDIAKFEKDLESSANTVFGVNMAIVGSSNLVTMGNIFGLKSPIKTGITDFIEKKAFGRGLTEVVDDAGKVTYNVMTRTGKQKSADFFVNYLAKPMVTEGLFEEGLQGVTTKTANKWIEHGYDPKKTNESLDTMGLMYESMAEQYGTKEGWVENGLGMLIGVVGGSVNARSGEKQKASELEYKASVGNAFDKQFLQANLLANKVKGFNRSKAFFEEATNEAKKGNIVKSELAQKDGIIAFIHAKTELGESTKDIVEEAKTAMESVTAEQWNEAGIEDIEAHKEDTLSELGRLSESYKTNKKYWEYMIGNKIVGENSLKTSALDEVANKNLSNNKLIIESLTWSSVRGENANKYMNDLQEEISRQVGVEQASALNTMLDLSKQNKSVQRRQKRVSNQHKALIQKRDALVKRIERLNAAPREIETNKGVKNRDLANANQALLAVNEKINTLQIEADDIASQMNSVNEAQQYLGADFRSQKLGGSYISGNDLLNLDENINKFQGSLDFIKSADEVRGQYLEDLLDELSQTSEIFMLHQATTKMAASAKIENINSWIGAQLKKNKVMDANTNEWLSEVATQYRNRKLELLAEKAEIAEQEGNPEEVEQAKEELKNAEKGRVVPKSNEQKIKELEQERDEKIDKLKEGLQKEAPIATNTTQTTLIAQSEIEALKKIKRLDLKEDYFTLDFKTFSFFTDENGDIYTKEVGDIDVAKTQSKSARNIISAPDIATFNGKTKEEVADSLKNSWVKQEPNFFEQEDKQSPEEFEKTKEQIKELEQEKETILPEQNETTTNIQAENEKINKKIEAVNKEYDEKIKQLRGEDKRNKVEIYKQRIKDLLKGDYYNIEYLGEDLDELLKSRPNKEDIDRYRELKKQNSQSNEMKALKRRLKNWKLLDAAIGEDYTSIADMIDIINQLEEGDVKETTKTDITTEDAETMIDAKGEINDVTLLQNMSSSVTVKAMTNGNLSFSHLKLTTFYDRLGGEITINGKSATREDLETLKTFKKDVNVEIQGIPFTLKPAGKIEVKKTTFDAMKNVLNMYILNPESTSNTYKPVSEFVAGETRKIISEFEENIEVEAIFNVAVDDVLEFTLDQSDNFNADLLRDYNDGKIDKDEVIARVKVAATKNGKKVSVIKAQRDDVSPANFMRLRLKAAEHLIENKSAVLGVNTKVDAVYIGTPEYQMDERGRTVQIPITKEAAEKEVKATGYIEDGNLTMSNEFPNSKIVTYFVNKLARKNKGMKIPFVVIKRGVHNIAYPVSLIKTQDNRLQEFKDTLNSGKSAQEVAIDVNNLVLKYKIGNANLIVVEDLENGDLINKIAGEFENNVNFLSVEDFASKDYDRQNIPNDITADIDFNNPEKAISDIKLRVSFEQDMNFEQDNDFKEMGDLPGYQIDVDVNDANNGAKNICN